MTVDHHGEHELSEGQPTSALFLDEVMGDLRFVKTFLAWWNWKVHTLPVFD